MIGHHCNLNRNGIHCLATEGDYSVVVNRALHERDKVSKYAVASDAQDRVDSVHTMYESAIRRMGKMPDGG